MESSLEYTSPTSSSSSLQETLVDLCIGSVVSLIANNYERYKGVIYHLDRKNSTLALQNVTWYGREDEKSNDDQETQIFNGSIVLFSERDIKDLKVLSLPAQPNYDYLLGHVLNVITKEDVRCEGNITHVNLHKSLITMKNVKCYGTEERKKRKRSKRLACNQLPGQIKFHFKDIKEVEIIFLPPMVLQVPARESDEFPPLTLTHIGQCASPASVESKRLGQME